MVDCPCICHGTSTADYFHGVMENYSQPPSCEHCQPAISEPDESASPSDILKKRFARGEIDEDEYWHAKEIIDS